MPNPFDQFDDPNERKPGNPFDQFGSSPQPRKKLSGLDAFLSGAGDALSFGWGDEIQGGLAGLGAMLSGGDYWDTYNRSTRDARNWQKMAEIDEGGWKFAGELGGALAGGVLGGGGITAAGRLAQLARGVAPAAAAAAPVRNMGLLARMGRAAPFAAGGGALYGAGASDGGENGDMLLNTVIGGGIGAAAGPVLTGLGALGKRAVIDPLIDLQPTQRASKYIQEELKRYNIDANDVARGAKEAADVDPKNAWAMDAFGPLGPDLVRASSASAGRPLADMQSAAKLRNVDIGEGARDSFWKGLGGGKRERINYVSRVSEIDDELASFDNVYKSIDAQKLDPATFPKELTDFVNRNADEAYKLATSKGTKDVTEKAIGPFKEAMDDAVEVMRGELGANIPAQVLMSQPKFWRTFLTMARHAKDDAWMSNNKTKGEVRSQQYNKLKALLGDDNVLGKDWVKAQERYAALKMERDGLEFGFKAVMETDAPRLADNLKSFNAMSPAQKKWARKGMIARLEEGIRSQQTRGATRDMLRKVGDNPLQRDALARFFARVNKDGSIDNRFTKLTDMLEDLDKRYTFFDNIERSGILKGPKTAHVLTGAADQADRTLPVAGEVLKGNILGALRRALTGDSSARFNQDVADEIIKFMQTPARITDRSGNLVGGLEHEIASKGLKKWLDGPSAVQKALKRQMQLQKAYENRWADARGNAFAGVGGGAVGALLLEPDPWEY